MAWWRREKNLAVVLTCADWRLHLPRVNLVRRLDRMLGVAVADLVALPGPDGLLRPERSGDWAAVKGWIKFLADTHKAVTIAVVAHQKCLGHPVSDAQHETDVAAVAKALKQDLGFAGAAQAIVAVHRSDSDWGLKPVARF